MKVELQIDDTASEVRVLVVARSLDESVRALMKRISDEHPLLLVGFREGAAYPLKQDGIVRIYASGGKVLAVTEAGEYMLRLRLYELEERLDKRRFVRISNAEIINLGWVKGFDLNLAGTIRVRFRNADSTFVSRRYVSRIKKVLGI